VSGDLDPKRWQLVRPEVALLAAQGLRNDEIAARLECSRDWVSQWREHFYAHGRSGLEHRWPTLPDRGSG
jgi:transposase